ncbi:MAG TPA: hypothetical protein VMK66_20630 [Myxococcales bacterium]|nr:hypothetical protein [Myxococcales bacterium]
MENQQQAGGGGRVRPWAAYNIVERGGRRFWNRVGSAFHNRDGSMNIFLDSLPRDGKIQIREDDRDRGERRERGALAEESVEALDAAPAEA